MTSATSAARAILDELARAGVEHVVVAPGSRSAPLAMAAFDADTSGSLRLHVRIDERTAGFLALGLAKVSGRPVPVVTTSGTAVANVHPAMLEAHHAGVPLVAVTADRPAHMRGTGANQTTRQVGIFGDAVRFEADLPAAASEAALRATIGRAASAALGVLNGDPGPVHVNVQFAEPLVPSPHEQVLPGRDDGAPWTQATPNSPSDAGAVLGDDLRTVVVAGDNSGPPARLLAQHGCWPLFAEPSSGARTGAALRTYRLLLANAALANDIERVVVFGHPTLSRPVSRLLSRDDVEIVVVTPTASWPDPAHRVSRIVTSASAAAKADPAWLTAWTDADHALSKALDDLVAAEPGLTPYEVAAEVARAVPPGGLFTVGSSSPIRDLDIMAAPYPVGERRKIIANRGLSGIDGTVSTAIGAALGRDSSRAVALLGDLTFVHDINGLTIGPDEPRPDLTIVVLNDNGGRIFATLEQGAPAFEASFERVFATPPSVDLAALCAASRTPHRRVDDRESLAEALANPTGGVEVIEAVVDGSRRRRLDETIRAL